MKTSWYKNAVIYALEIDNFYDSNADGIGDFQGLIQKMGYLSGLGVTCLWLLPFFPSPNRDNGYDVSDYYAVDDRLGCLGDFIEFMDQAEVYGIKVIIDLPLNHTSIEHPWFQKAKTDEESFYRNFYIWSDEVVPFDWDKLAFKGEEHEVWSWNDEARQYYLHRFYKEQPDLNIMNPIVRTEILKIMGFWLKLGVSGFRIDAAKNLIEPYGLKGATRPALESSWMKCAVLFPEKIRMPFFLQRPMPGLKPQLPFFAAINACT